jgi:trk system potassium uptake protein TrkA
MKSFLIIGMGSLGNHLCDELSKNSCEIMIADINPAKVENVNSAVVTARVCDCTNRSVLESLGVEDFDVCFVCIEDYFQACLEITDLLKELGAKKIYSTANRQIEEKFLLRSGADCIIYPERDICRRISSVECAKHIFDYINIADDYSIFEIEPHKKWLGKTVMELNFRNRYKLNIIAYKKQGKVIPLFNADYTFNSGEHLLVLGNRDELNKILK